MANEIIRETATRAGVKLYQIAHELGINDGNFSRKLRYELSEDEKRKILDIISRLGG